MKIELTDRDAAVLHGVLTTRLGDMSVEIAATDNPVFRASLRARRDAVRRVCELLSSAVAER